MGNSLNYQFEKDLSSIGFMQGRLSPLVNGRIQSFPWDNWKEEIAIGPKYGFVRLEWVLDQENLYKNPIMTQKGRKEIKCLLKKNNISVNSLTGDCFMQQPFFKAEKKHRSGLLKDLKNIIESCSLIGIRFIVFPLVDEGSIENDFQERILKDVLNSLVLMLKEANIVICFESDFVPERLLNFINQFEPNCFGINYDVGNSASLGYLPREEITLYGHRIMNVHVKDRLLHGTTVPLREGNADIPAVLESLMRSGYKGNYVLQTARAVDNNHVSVLIKYRDLLVEMLDSVGIN